MKEINNSSIVTDKKLEKSFKSNVDKFKIVSDSNFKSVAFNNDFLDEDGVVKKINNVIEVKKLIDKDQFDDLFKETINDLKLVNEDDLKDEVSKEIDDRDLITTDEAEDKIKDRVSKEIDDRELITKDEADDKIKNQVSKEIDDRNLITEDEADDKIADKVSDEIDSRKLITEDDADDKIKDRVSKEIDDRKLITEDDAEDKIKDAVSDEIDNRDLITKDDADDKIKDQVSKEIDDRDLVTKDDLDDKVEDQVSKEINDRELVDKDNVVRIIKDFDFPTKNFVNNLIYDAGSVNKNIIVNSDFKIFQRGELFEIRDELEYVTVDRFRSMIGKEGKAIVERVGAKKYLEVVANENILLDKVDPFGDKSCQAMYPFDGDANDKLGKYNGQWKDKDDNDIDGVYDVGVFGKAAKFDGNSYIKLHKYSVPITISFWAKNVNGDDIRCFVQDDFNDDGDNWNINIKSDDGKVYFNGGYTDANSKDSIDNINAFNHVVLVFPDNNVHNMKFYINGIDAGSEVTNDDKNNIRFTSFIYLGKSRNGLALDGTYIDQVRIFNKALTEEEVKALYKEQPSSFDTYNLCDPLMDLSSDYFFDLNEKAVDLCQDKAGSWSGNEDYTDGLFDKKSANFDGDSYIDTKVGMLNYIKHGGTFSVWVKGDPDKNDDYVEFFGQRDENSIASFSLYWNNEKDTLVFVNSGGSDVKTIAYENFNDIIKEWTHIAVSFDGNGKFYGYVNGEFIGSEDLSSNDSDKNYNACIGTAKYNSKLKGQMQNVRIFNRQLSDDEIKKIYKESMYSDAYDPVSDVDPFKDDSGIALYQLDGSAKDTGGNYNGSWDGNEQYDDGKFGKGAKFDGKSKVIYDDKIENVLGISMWVYYQGGEDDYVVFTRETNGGQKGLNLCYDKKDECIYLSNEDDDGNGAGITFDKKLDEDTWYHFVITKDKDNNEVKLYVNNDNIKIKDGEDNKKYIKNDIAKLSIGRLGDKDSYGLKGIVDQFRIFNRQLTDEDVKQIYEESYKKSIVNEYDPFKDNSGIALFKFDDDLKDASGNYNASWKDDDGNDTDGDYDSGIFGKSAEFAGETYIETDFGVEDDNLTISFWYNTQNRDISDVDQRLWSLNINGGGDANVTGVNVYKGKLNFYKEGEGLLDYEIKRENKFRHVVFNVKDKKLYYDGELLEIDNDGKDRDSGQDKLFIASYKSHKQFFKGEIDQFRIFNRGLTDEEVKALYEEQLPIVKSTTIVTQKLNQYKFTIKNYPDVSSSLIKPLSYKLEGNELYTSLIQYGFLTLSFNMTSSKKGLYAVSIINIANDEKECVVLTFDYNGYKDENITVTIPNLFQKSMFNSTEPGWELVLCGYSENSKYIGELGYNEGYKVCTNKVTKLDKDDYIAFSNIKLEIGRVATKYTPNDYSEELMKCKRYYEVIPYAKVVNTSDKEQGIPLTIQYFDKNHEPSITFEQKNGNSVSIEHVGSNSSTLVVDCGKSGDDNDHEVLTNIIIDAEI